MPLSTIEQHGSPLSNQIEICLFGMGFGESILIHLGNNNWAIIDSFLHPKTTKPIALEYLESISVDIASCVKIVIATHWHDDHIKGMAEIVSKTPNARFVFSQVMQNDKFKKFVKRHQTRILTASGSKVDEIDKIFEFFFSKPKGRTHPNPCLTSQNKPLLQLDAADVQLPMGCKILSLSPSDTDFWNFIQSIAKMMPADGKPKRSAKRITENQASVVTWVGYDDLCFLFGADMEKRPANDTGWNAIVNSDTRPKQKSSVYKVPHHGSATGHCESIWDQLLHEKPMAIVTPFINGRVKLPTPEQIKAILEQSPNFFATGIPSEGKAKKRSAAVEKEIKDGNIKLKPRGSGLGMVRLRSMPITTAIDQCVWSVELLGDAKHLLH